MGQKTNPNILRLGVTKHWKTEFFEKKINELPKYTFKDLELKSYSERFLNKHGLFLHDYRQKFGNSSLVFYFSYFISPIFSKKFYVNKKRMKIVATNGDRQKKTIIKINDVLYNKKKHLNKKLKPFFGCKFNVSSMKTYKYLMFNYNQKFKTIKFANHKNLDLKGIIFKFLKTINLFTKNKYNLIFNISCLNKELKFLTTKKNIKQIILKMKKFKNNAFFKNGIELLLNGISNKNSANLFIKFIAGQIKKDKKHKFFLSFLKKILTPLLKSNISILKGIKIKLNGRLNGAPKAKQKIITVGDIPAQSISTFIDYSHDAIHTKNGTYGIKVWTVSK